MLYVNDEKRWRHALELVGRERIEDLLRRYPGGPDELVTDLPVQAPFPTREFCRQWCVTTSSRGVRGYVAVGVAMALMATIAVSYAACAISPFNTTTSNVASRGPAPVVPAGTGGMTNLKGPSASDQVPTAATRKAAAAAQSSGSGRSSMPSNSAPPQVPGTYRVQTVTAVPSTGLLSNQAASGK